MATLLVLPGAKRLSRPQPPAPGWLRLSGISTSITSAQSWLERPRSYRWPYQRQPIFDRLPNQELDPEAKQELHALSLQSGYVAQTGMASSEGFVHPDLHVSSGRWRTSGSWILGIRQAPDSLRAPRIDPILRLPRPHPRANNPKKQAKPPPDCRTRRRLVQSN